MDRRRRRDDDRIERMGREERRDRRVGVETEAVDYASSFSALGEKAVFRYQNLVRGIDDSKVVVLKRKGTTLRLNSLVTSRTSLTATGREVWK